jgi:hypothetical protein
MNSDCELNLDELDTVVGGSGRATLMTSPIAPPARSSRRASMHPAPTATQATP